MFGYVMADADRLSDKDAARYRAAYCGVCHSLSERFAVGRLLLSFDMAFLCIFYNFLYTRKSGAEISVPVFIIGVISKFPYKSSSASVPLPHVLPYRLD